MRKSRNVKQQEIEYLRDALLSNGEAKLCKKQKVWTQHDLVKIQPLTENQKIAFKLHEEYDYVVLDGSPGTGKTFINLYFALRALIVRKTHSKIIILRSAVASRDQGFLPGNLDEKSAPFEEPYISIFQSLLGKPSSYHDMKEAGFVTFKTSGYLRGITFDDAIVLCDETQNMSWHEINTVMTRVGENTKIFISADNLQSDLKRGESGYLLALKIWKEMREFGVISFTFEDIVRSDFVKQWIIKSEYLKAA